MAGQNPRKPFCIFSNNLLSRLVHVFVSFSHLFVCSHQHTEALLYGFQSIAETIDVNYSDVIPGLIGLIPRININNVQLADTVMFTIGLYVGYKDQLFGCLRFKAHSAPFSFVYRSVGGVVSRSPSHVEQCVATGASGIRESRPFYL